jgi:hypothetical protein
MLEKENFFTPGKTSSSRNKQLNLSKQKFENAGNQMKNVKTKSFVFTKNLHFVVKKQALQILKA